MGQESRHSSVGSSVQGLSQAAMRGRPGLCSHQRLVWGRICLQAHMAVGRIQTAAEDQIEGLSSLLNVSWRPLCVLSAVGLSVRWLNSWKLGNEESPWRPSPSKMQVLILSNISWKWHPITFVLSYWLEQVTDPAHIRGDRAWTAGVRDHSGPLLCLSAMMPEGSHL